MKAKARLLSGKREVFTVFFKKPKPSGGTYDRDRFTPVIRCSICTGEQVAGFREKGTGRLEEVMLLRSPRDLEDFRARYGITEEIERIY